MAKQKNSFPWPLTDRGLAATDAELRVLGHPHVFAIGDTATAERQLAESGGAAPLPATAQVCSRQCLQQCLALYRSPSLSRPEDTPERPKL